MRPGEAAHAVNVKIAQIAQAAEDGWHFDFLCECGCFEKVSMTAEEYLSAGEARSPGHDPSAAASAA